MDTFPPLNALPCFANLTADQVEWKEPRKHAECPRINFPDKDAKRAYVTDEKTQSCLISSISGINRHQRVSRNNPPARLHAIVADFDSRIDEVKRKKYLAFEAMQAAAATMLKIIGAESIGALGDDSVPRE